MTIDKSLKVRAALMRTRSVLTRAERIEKLQSLDRWAEGDSPVGLAKVRVYKLQMKKKKKEKTDDDAPAKGKKK
ncbi:MAG: small basic protein [Thermoguttaceae bacterium]|nr:small basic protein [Planctomycetaceae bacterium]MBO5438596.1 small basic protein [Thermoguttaceae bacterium]MBP3693756.1 small basic protein [Thermoguttaceae bacterium]MBQ4143003.1 small basic protein [Thermoguttaceae bacterium]